MKCSICGRAPSEIIEYKSSALAEGIDPDEFVRQFEGTYNKKTNEFLCTDCFLAKEFREMHIEAKLLDVVSVPGGSETTSPQYLVLEGGEDIPTNACKHTDGITCHVLPTECDGKFYQCPCFEERIEIEPREYEANDSPLIF